MKARQAGFTLMEVMIAMLLIAILTSIAVPSYQESVRRSKRSEVRTAILGLAQALERYYTNNNTYAGASLGGAAPLFPSKVPAAGSTNYNLELVISADPVTGLADANYTITATRAGSQANDACGDFVLTASGARSLKSNTKTVADCWN